MTKKGKKMAKNAKDPGKVRIKEEIDSTANASVYLNEDTETAQMPAIITADPLEDISPQQEAGMETSTADPDYELLQDSVANMEVDEEVRSNLKGNMIDGPKLGKDNKFKLNSYKSVTRDLNKLVEEFSDSEDENKENVPPNFGRSYKNKSSDSSNDFPETSMSDIQISTEISEIKEYTKTIETVNPTGVRKNQKTKIFNIKKFQEILSFAHLSVAIIYMCVYLIFSPGASARKITDGVEIHNTKLDEIEFAKVGLLGAEIDYAHLMLTMPLDNLATLYENVKMDCYNLKAAKQVYAAKMGKVDSSVQQFHHVLGWRKTKDLDYAEHKSVEYHFKPHSNLCTETLSIMERELENVKIYVTDSEPLNGAHLAPRDSNRPKKFGFLGGMLLMGIGGAMTYTVEHLFHLHKEITMADNQKKLLHYVNMEEVQLKNLTLRAEELDKFMLLKFNAMEIKSYFNDRLAEADRNILNNFHRFEELTKGIYATARGELSPQLIDLSILKKAVTEIQKKVTSEYRFLGLERNSDIFKLKANSLVKSGKLHIFIDIPLVGASGYMNLYRLIPATINVATGQKMCVVQNQYLAVSKDETSYRIVPDNELKQCLELQPGQFYCSNQILKHNFTENCLSALYKKELTRAWDLCEVRLMPQKDWAIQISREEFLINLEKENMATFSCMNNSEKAQFWVKGANFLQLRDCTMRLPAFTINGKRDLSLTVSLKETRKLAQAYTFPNLSAVFTEAELQNILEQIHFEEPISLQKMLRLKPVSNNHIWKFIFGSILAFLMSIILACGIYMYLIYKRNGRQDGNGK